MTNSDYTSGWNDALVAAAKTIRSRDAQGYVPDVGCHACFGRIADAVIALATTNPSTNEGTDSGVAE